MAVQTTVSAQPTTAAPGRIHRVLKTPVSVSRVCDQSGGIPFGVFVVRDGSDVKVDLPTSAAEIESGLLGIALEDNSKAYDSTGYANGDGLGVLLEGACYVKTEEAVAQGEAVYVRHTSDGGSNTALGLARNDADTNRCARAADCVFAETTSGAGYALVLKSGAQGKNFGYVTLRAELADVSAASAVYLPVPVNGTIERVVTVLGGVITGADSVLTLHTLAGGTGSPAAVTHPTFTIANVGSAAGVTDVNVPTAANTVAVGDSIRVTTDGASSTTATLGINVLIKVTEP